MGIFVGIASTTIIIPEVNWSSSSGFGDSASFFSIAENLFVSHVFSCWVVGHTVSPVSYSSGYCMDRQRDGDFPAWYLCEDLHGTELGSSSFLLWVYIAR